MCSQQPADKAVASGSLDIALGSEIPESIAGTQALVFYLPVHDGG